MGTDRPGADCRSGTASGRLIERQTGLPDGGVALIGPSDKGGQRFEDRNTKMRQSVFDAWRLGGKHRARDQAVTLQIAEGRRVGPARRAVSTVLQVAGLIRWPYWAISPPSHGRQRSSPQCRRLPRPYRPSWAARVARLPAGEHATDC